MLAALLVTAMLQDRDLPLKIEEGGFCTGMAWMTVEPSAQYSFDRGPDFRVFRYSDGNGDWWGVYSGHAAQVSNGKRKRLFKRHGVRVDAMTVDGEFRGYLASDRSGSQNHFFSSRFKNDREDIAFFDKVDFGPHGQEKCERHRPR